MANRINELLELARAGDDDVQLLVRSEIALQPDTRKMLIERASAAADAYAQQFAPVQDIVSTAVLDKMADEAGF